MDGEVVGALLDASGLADQVARLDLPGIVVRVSGSSGVCWSDTFGVADLTSGQPMTAGLRMRVGSLTKMFTATLVLQFVDRGHLRLDMPLTELLPRVGWLPSAELITVRQLLGMRSGVYDYTETEAADRLFLPADQRWSHGDLVELVRRHEPYGPPGQGFRYSNTNYALLALVVEHITGLPYRRALQPLLEQAGLTSTSDPTGSTVDDPAASGYLRVTEATTRQQLANTRAVPAHPQFRDVTSIAASAAGAAGGLVSTAADLDVFVRAVADGSLLSEQLHRQQLDPQPVGFDDSGYGLGVAYYRGLIGHHGSIPGYSSYTGHHQPTGLTITVLASCADGANGASVMLLVDHIIDAIRQ